MDILNNDILKLDVPHILKQPGVLLEQLCLEYDTDENLHPDMLAYCQDRIGLSGYCVSILSHPSMAHTIKHFVQQCPYPRLLLIGVHDDEDAISSTAYPYIQTGLGLVKHEIYPCVSKRAQHSDHTIDYDPPSIYRIQEIQYCLAYFKLYANIQSVCMLSVAYRYCGDMVGLLDTLPSDTGCLIQAPQALHSQIIDCLSSQTKVRKSPKNKK